MVRDQQIEHGALENPTLKAIWGWWERWNGLLLGSILMLTLLGMLGVYGVPMPITDEVMSLPQMGDMGTVEIDIASAFQATQEGSVYWMWKLVYAALMLIALEMIMRTVQERTRYRWAIAFHDTLESVKEAVCLYVLFVMLVMIWV